MEETQRQVSQKGDFANLSDKLSDNEKGGLKTPVLSFLLSDSFSPKRQAGGSSPSQDAINVDVVKRTQGAADERLMKEMHGVFCASFLVGIEN